MNNKESRKQLRVLTDGLHRYANTQTLNPQKFRSADRKKLAEFSKKREDLLLHISVSDKTELSSNIHAFCYNCSFQYQKCIPKCRRCGKGSVVEIPETMRPWKLTGRNLDRRFACHKCKKTGQWRLFGCECSEDGQNANHFWRMCRFCCKKYKTTNDQEDAHENLPYLWRDVHTGVVWEANRVEGFSGTYYTLTNPATGQSVRIDSYPNPLTGRLEPMIGRNNAAVEAEMIARQGVRRER